MYKIRSTGLTFKTEELQAQFPNTSLPAVLSQGDYDFLDIEVIPDPEPTEEELAAKALALARAFEDQIVMAMSVLFDQTAQAKHYDNRISCALRAGYPGPFHDEGAAFATWMDMQNATAYTMLAQVQAGTMAMPATVEDALALLDPMVWPE